MVNIYIVFDNDYDDADVISVPDFIFDNIDRFAQEYLDWIPPRDDPANWKQIDGRPVLNKETVGFVDWLNEKYLNNSEKAVIAEQHIPYCGDNKVIEF